MELKPNKLLNCNLWLTPNSNSTILTCTFVSIVLTSSSTNLIYGSTSRGYIWIPLLMMLE
jgi:hypothetical protein